jgi:DNA-binding LytR/AlgR family response regulator
MNPLKVLIVDDEPLARDVMKAHLEHIPNTEIIKECGSAIEAGDVLRNEEIDLMFLDIQMPGLSGIEFIKSLDNPPLVVFTTAYPKYAVEGFELNALDYLVKPVSFERFYKAINKAQDTLNVSASTDNVEEDYIFVKADKKLQKIFFNEIYYIEGLKDYVIIKLEKERVVTLQTMKSLIQKLPENTFRRIHRSYIINLDKIDAIYGNVVEMIINREEKHLPIGKNYREELLELVNKHKL